MVCGLILVKRKSDLGYRRPLLEVNVRKEYENRWDAPLVNPGFTMAEYDRDNGTFPCLYCQKPIPIETTYLSCNDCRDRENCSWESMED